MEGMITKEILPLQEDYIALGTGKLTINQWAQGLVIKLLEVTHGQWLYRNVHVHDAITRWRTVEKRKILNSMPLNSTISEWLVKWGGPDTVIVA